MRKTAMAVTTTAITGRYSSRKRRAIALRLIRDDYAA